MAIMEIDEGLQCGENIGGLALLASVGRVSQGLHFLPTPPACLCRCCSVTLTGHSPEMARDSLSSPEAVP